MHLCSQCDFSQRQQPFSLNSASALKTSQIPNTMFHHTQTLFSPIRRFRPKSKIPVIITKDHIPSTNRSSSSVTAGASVQATGINGTIGRVYFAGERRRVKAGVMRYVLFPKGIAVYETADNLQKWKKFWRENPQYKEYLKEKKTLYSLERYLKTKSLVISEPITKSIIQRYLDYLLNVKVNTENITISKSSSPDSFGKRIVSVRFHPIGYTMKFPAWYSAVGEPFNHFAYERLGLKAKDEQLSRQVEREIRQKSAQNNQSKVRNFIKETKNMYVKRDPRKMKQASKDGNVRPPLTQEEKEKRRQDQRERLQKLRESQVKRLGQQ